MRYFTVCLKTSRFGDESVITSQYFGALITAERDGYNQAVGVLITAERDGYNRTAEAILESFLGGLRTCIRGTAVV